MYILLLIPIISLAFQNCHASNKKEWLLDLNIGSKHTVSHYGGWYMVKGEWKFYERTKFNEINLGLGFSYGLFNHLDLKVGFFKNSYYQYSFYTVCFLHKDFHKSNFLIAPGLLIALASGYDNTPEDMPILAFIPLPAITLGHRILSANFGFSPYGSVKFVTFQMSLNISQILSKRHLRFRNNQTKEALL